MPWVRVWQSRVAEVFTHSYARALAQSDVLPANPEDIRVLLHTHLVERAIYEVGYELNRRSGLVAEPLEDLTLLLPRPERMGPRPKAGRTARR